jgi:hypothetical protein
LEDYFIPTDDLQPATYNEHFSGNRVLAMDETGSDRHFEGDAGEGLFGGCFVDALDFEQYGAGFYDGCPVFGFTFAGAHTHFERFGGDRLMREDADKDATFATHKVAGGYATGFDLLGGDPGVFFGLETELAEGDGVAAAGDSTILTALTFAEFNPLGHHWHRAPK